MSGLLWTNFRERGRLKSNAVATQDIAFLYPFMNSSQNPHRVAWSVGISVSLVSATLLLIGIGCILLSSCGGGGARPVPPPPPPPAVPPQIIGSASSVEQVLSPGESFSQNVTFRSDRSFQSAFVEATGSIAPFVTISPTSIATVLGGHEQSVIISGSIPLSAILGTLSGAIRVRTGSQPLTQELIAVLNVWGAARDAQGSFEVKIPPGWTQQQVASPFDSNIRIGSKVSVTIVRSPTNSSIHILPEGEFDYGIDTSTARTSQILIDGRPATRLDFFNSQQSLEFSRIELEAWHRFRIELRPRSSMDFTTLEQVVSTIRLF